MYQWWTNFSWLQKPGIWFAQRYHRIHLARWASPSMHWMKGKGKSLDGSPVYFRSETWPDGHICTQFHTYGQFRVSGSPGLWKEASVPEGNPQNTDRQGCDFHAYSFYCEVTMLQMVVAIPLKDLAQRKERFSTHKCEQTCWISLYKVVIQVIYTED